MMLIMSVFGFFVFFEMFLNVTENKGSYGMQMLLGIIAIASLPIIIGLLLKIGH